MLDGIETLHERWKYRYYESHKYFVPYLLKNGLSSTSRVVEIGCGQGPKSFSIAPHCKEVLGFDLSGSHIENAHLIQERTGIANVRFFERNAAEAGDLLADLGRGDFMLCYAILEHLLPEELITLFAFLHKHLKAGVKVAFVETPNRLATIDRHTSFLPFFDTLPIEIAARYGKNSKRDWYALGLTEQPGSEFLYRNGRGLSFHDFELAFDKFDRMNDIVLADNWSVEMLNMHPHHVSEVTTWEGFAATRTDSTIQKTNVPPLFFRYWLEGILSFETTSPPPMDLEQLVLTGDFTGTYRNARGIPSLRLKPDQSYRFRKTLKEDTVSCEVLLGIGMEATGSIRVISDSGEETRLSPTGGAVHQFDQWRKLHYHSVRFQEMRNLRIINEGSAVTSIAFPLIRRFH